MGKSKREKEGSFSFIPIVIIIIILAAIGLIWYFFNENIKDTVGNIVSNIQAKMDGEDEEVREEKTEETKNIEKNNNEISFDEAMEKAILEFEKLGEEGLEKTDLELLKVKRDEVEYFRIFSGENTIEIIISDGRINRINGEKVDN